MLEDISAQNTSDYVIVFYRIGTDDLHIWAYEDHIREYMRSYTCVFSLSVLLTF